MEEPRKGPPPVGGKPAREAGGEGPPPVGRSASPGAAPREPRRGAKRIALSVLYWLAVLVVSLAILVGLILLLESRDNSEIQSGAIVTSASPS